MSGLVVCIVFQVVGVGDDRPPTYEEAYEQAQRTGQPLVVLVGANWCPACQSLKDDVLAPMQRSGKLAKVSFAVVNYDREKELASKLMRGSSIPQLIVFYRNGTTSWSRQQITGATDEKRVVTMIDKAAALTAKSQSEGTATVTR